jgi:hypothetical protein
VKGDLMKNKIMQVIENDLENLRKSRWAAERNKDWIDCLRYDAKLIYAEQLKGKVERLEGEA